MTDASHDPKLRCWVPGANGHPEFPIQNLPFGVFSPAGGRPRGGVAIGDWILDIAATLDAGLFSGIAAKAAEAAAGQTLNALMAIGKGPRRALRQRLCQLLDANSADGAKTKALADRILHKATDCVLHLPARVGDYTDFYSGIQHATNVGRLLRPDNPLMPNYKYLPVGYHGRASSVRASGTPIRRPKGQRKPATEERPSFGPSRNLDYELEIGIWIGPGNEFGQPIPIQEAAHHIVGYCLLNDWSARDIQAWEYQPLGPFLAKSFGTTVSPWVVTAEALQPFRVAQRPRPEGDPKPLAYLWDETDQSQGALDIDLEVMLMTEGLRAKGLSPYRLSSVKATELYWTAAQLVAHHSSGGCNLIAGDLLGTGTISGQKPDSVGSLLELTRGGREPIELPSGEARRFLEDGDEVIFRASCRRKGLATIGFGECRARILPAV